MSSTNVAFASLLALLAITIWRIHTGRTADRYRTAWAAGLLALIIAFAASAAPTLGAVIAFLILVSILGKSGSGAGQALSGVLNRVSPGSVTPRQPANAATGGGPGPGGAIPGTPTPGGVVIGPGGTVTGTIA